MSALYLTRDLLFSSQVTSVAASCGLEMRVVSDEAALRESVAAGDVHCVLIDLSMPNLALLQLVPELRIRSTLPLRIIAFGPHVNVAGLAGARQSGCDEVFTRGQFHHRMPDILRQFGCSV
jgi:DNA-binding response OmpR family regulator